MMVDGHERVSMHEEVVRGLRSPQPSIPSKYFYDERGSRLFDQITRLPEYYPTRAERRVLRACISGWIRETGPLALVEFGAGSADKTRVILDALVANGGSMYVPIDVSARFLSETARKLDREYPGLTVRPAVGDMTGRIELGQAPPAPAWYALLGSTIGNFERDQAVAFLGRVARGMRRDDRFLLGVDLIKNRQRLEAAYDDSAGVTAEFNRNILRVLNRELGTDFDPAAYDHRAPFDKEKGRIEMHLVSRTDQTVRIPGAEVFSISAGESIRTEISCKYDRQLVEEMLAAAGLRLDRWEEAQEDPYAVALASPRVDDAP